MGVIKLLDKEVSQLIAAGEVVERPVIGGKGAGRKLD